MGRSTTGSADADASAQERWDSRPEGDLDIEHRRRMCGEQRVGIAADPVDLPADILGARRTASRNLVGRGGKP